MPIQLSLEAQNTLTALENKRNEMMFAHLFQTDLRLPSARYDYHATYVL